MPALRSLTFAAIGCGLCLLCSVADARPLVKRPIVDDPRGSVIARVLASFTAHAVPAGNWYTDALHGRHVNSRRYFGFARQFETATFVSFTYTWFNGAERHSRVYHARSGRNEPSTGFSDIHGVRPYRQYFGVDRPEVIAWDEAAPEGSDVTSSPVMGDMHATARQRDAELKVARRIEADIAAGRIMRGGTLNVYSSQVPCPSCEAALQALSDQYDITIHIAWLSHGSPAYRIFHRQRHQHMSTIQVMANGGQRASLELESVLSVHTLQTTTPSGCGTECEGSGEAVELEPVEVPYDVMM